MSSDKPNFLSQPVVKNIFMYRNGDPYYEPRRFVINQRRVCNFETLLREVTGGVQASFGAVRTIYTPRGGHRVDSLDHLHSGEQYVAAGSEKFKKLDYLQIGSRRKRMMLPLQAKPVPQSRIIVSARFLKPIKEPCPIFVVANGDVLNPAQRLLINQRMLGQFDKILEIITEKMGLRVLGGVRSLFTFEGHQVTDGKQLESGQFYVAVGREKFKKLPYSDLLFTKPRGMRRVNGTKASSLPPIYRFSKQNGNNKSMLRCSDSGGDTKVSPPAHSGNKDHLSSIVREISQARLISIRKKRSRISMSLGVSDNDDLESKIDDGNVEDKTPQDQSAEEKPAADDTKGSEGHGEEEGEKGEAAAENTAKDEGEKKEPAAENTTKDEGEKKEDAAENTTKEEGEEEAAAENAAKEEGEKEEAAAENAAKDEGEKKEDAAENTTKEEGEKKEEDAENTTKDGREKEAAAAENTTKEEEEKEEAAAENTTKEEAEKEEAAAVNTTKEEEEKEEAAAENTTKDDTSTSKDKKKENQESNNELEGGATPELGLVNRGGGEKEEKGEEAEKGEEEEEREKEEEGEKEEEIKEVIEEAKHEVQREEQGASNNTARIQDTTEKEAGKHTPPSKHAKEEQDKNEGKEEKDEDSGKGSRDKGIEEQVNGLDTEGEEEENNDETGENHSDNKTKESRNSSSNSNQEKDKTKTKEGATEGSGGEEREMNGETDGEDEDDSEGKEEENPASTKDAKANGEKRGDVDRNKTDKTDKKDEERK